MDTKSFTVYIKTDNIYVDLAKDFEKRFDTRIRIRIWIRESITYRKKMKKLLDYKENELDNRENNGRVFHIETKI